MALHMLCKSTKLKVRRKLHTAFHSQVMAHSLSQYYAAS